MGQRKRCIITVGVGLRYHLGVQRLKRSIMRYADTDDFDFLGYLEFPEECPKHSQTPFTFKYYFIDHARKQGYRQVLYLDAAYIVKKIVGTERSALTHVWQQLEQDGYYFTKEELVPSIGHFCHDQALRKLELDREPLFEWKSIRGGCFGLDFRHRNANRWLDRMLELGQDNICFPGSRLNREGICSKDSRVLGHLHDQTIGSIVAYQLGMERNWQDFSNNFYQDRSLVKPEKTTIYTTCDWETQYWWGKADFSLPETSHPIIPLLSTPPETS